MANLGTLVFVSIILFTSLITVFFHFSQPVGQLSQPPLPPAISSMSVEETNYIHSPGGIVLSVSGSEPSFHHQDRLGSTKIISTLSGNNQFSSDFHPFGKPFNQVGYSTYKFTGKEEDSTGLNYFGARYYDQETGRFTQVDPVGFAYSYAYNNPLKNIDPDGNLGIPGFIRNNWRPMLVTAAAGTLGYKIANKDLDLTAMASIAYLVSRVDVATNNLQSTRQASLPRGDLTLQDPLPVADLARRTGRENVAEAWERAFSQGKVKLKTAGVLSSRVDRGKVDMQKSFLSISDESQAGMTSLNREMTLSFITPEEVHQEYEKYLFIYPHVPESEFENAARNWHTYVAAHEAVHLTQGPARFWLNEFFGFGYDSRFNLIEQPARNFQNDIKQNLEIPYSPPKK